MSAGVTPVLVIAVLALACSAPARQAGEGSSHVDSTPATAHASAPRPWPIADSFPLQLPGEPQPLQVEVTSSGTDPCQGSVSIRIRRQATVLYADTLSFGPTDPCDEPALGAFWNSVYDLRSLHPTHAWDHLDEVVPLETRAVYGTPPYLFVYSSGWESARAIAWNPNTRRFDVLVEGGIW